jgi:hypothetical protein
MLIPLIVAAIGPRLRLKTAGAGIGALGGGILTNVLWSLLVSPGGTAVFIGLVGSVIGLLLGHAVSLWMGGKRVAGLGSNKILNDWSASDAHREAIR